MKQITTILFVNAGRRVELIKEFYKASLLENSNVLIIGTDMDASVPTSCFCDLFYTVPQISDSENYLSSLLEICKKHKVDFLIPTIDTDLLFLSRNQKQFEEINTKVLISNIEKIKICRDKNLTAKYFNKLNLLTPQTWDSIKNFNNQFPCFIKPKDGSSAKDAYIVNNEEELFAYTKKIKDYIIQEFILGEEYTVDIFCDLDGEPLFITPRKRLRVRDGEVIHTKICKDTKIIQECKKIIKDFRPCGAITVQLIRKDHTEDDYFIEVNPRFGGGAPLSIKAGANSPEVIINKFDDLADSVFIEVSNNEEYWRFDDSTKVPNTGESRKVKAVIFDLDDTLYNEIDYVKSGFKAIERYLDIDGTYESLLKLLSKEKYPLDIFLKSIDKICLKEDCLNIYRNHSPKIKLNYGALDVLKKLKHAGCKLGIITDGRPNGQRKKIGALNLDTIIDEIIITDELGGLQFRKPNDIAFRIMQTRMRVQFENMVYVGDNVSKDFKAPDVLGMQSVLFNNTNGLYKETDFDFDRRQINKLEDLISELDFSSS